MPTPQALKHTVVNNGSHGWPGYPDYDRVSVQNRVAFPSREAAEQAGYRRAQNCR